MFIDDPGPGIALDRQDAPLEFGVDMVTQCLLEGREEAVGEGLEDGIGHRPGRSTVRSGAVQPACRRAPGTVYPRPCCAGRSEIGPEALEKAS